MTLPAPDRPPAPAARRGTSAATSSRPTTARRSSTAGPTTCLPALKAGLAERGLELGDIRHLLLSHIHLDHAGAAGALVREHPALQVHVSAVGAPHLVDPSRLEASARRLYGDTFDALWGELVPVPGGEHPDRRRRRPRARVLPEHGPREPPRLDAARGRDAVRGRLGRACGSRPARFVLAPTPPPDIDLEAWERTIAADRAAGAGAARADALRRVRRRLRAPRPAPRDAAALGRARRPRHGRGDVRGGRPRRLPRVRSRTRSRPTTAPRPTAQCFLGLERYWRKRHARRRA